MAERTPGARAGRPKPATIYDVAARAGVSHQTVSRHLKGELLRPANRERVERALVDLDYRVNDVARELARGRPRRIGAFVFDVDDWAPQRVLSGAVLAAREAGYVLDIVRVDPSEPSSVETAIQAMNRSMVAGVVVLSPSDPVLDRLGPDRLRVPWVVEAEPELTASSSAQHPYAALVDHLAELGHERFFHVGGPSTWLAARNRRLAYRERLRVRGLQNCGESEGEWGAQWGYEAMASLPRDPHPTAVVAASDQLALGVLFWLHEHGVRVPEDISVVGYDGIPDAAYYQPPLTTLAVDFAHLGRATVQALLEPQDLGRRSHRGGPPAAELVVRVSAAPPPLSNRDLFRP